MIYETLLHTINPTYQHIELYCEPYCEPYLDIWNHTAQHKPCDDIWSHNAQYVVNGSAKKCICLSLISVIWKRKR